MMGAPLGESVLKLTVDRSGLDQGLQQARKSAQGFTQGAQSDLSKFSANFKQSVLAGVGLGAGITAWSALATGVDKAVQVVGDAITAASDLEESQSKVSVVFGESAAEVERWADTASTAFGQSKQQALEAAGTYGNLFQAFGIGQEKAQGMSTALVELAADLASFNNTSVDDALVALRSGLSGETEPLKRFGIALNDARMRSVLLDMGITDLGGTLTAQQKALAAYEVIMSDTALAQGDFERTSDGLANQQRILLAQWEDAKAILGEELLPIVTELVGSLNDLLGVATGRVEPLDALTRGAADSFLDFARSVGFSKEEIDRFDQAVDELIAGTFGQPETGLSAYSRISEEELARLQAAYRRHGPTVAGILEAGGPVVARGAEAGASGIAVALAAAREDAIEEARALPGDLAKALQQGQDDVESGMSALTDLMEESLSDAAKITYLQGVLSSEELQRGLTDERADVRAAAMAVQADALAQLQLLESGAADAAVDAGTSFAYQLGLQKEAAYAAAHAVAARGKQAMEDVEYGPMGEDAAREFADGLANPSSLQYAARKALALAGAVSGYLEGASPPPLGPLHHIDEWGGNLAETLFEGFGDAIRGLDLGTMIGGVVPSLEGGREGPTITNVYNITAEGQPFGTESREDLINILQALSPLNQREYAGA